MTHLTIQHVVRALAFSLLVSFLGWGIPPADAKGGGGSNNHLRVTATSAPVKTNLNRPVAKAAKLDLEKKKITDQKNAAQQRYNDQMDAANKGMILGITAAGKSIDASKKSDQLQIATDRAQAAVEKAHQQPKNTKDQNIAAKENIQKTIDQLNEIKRSTCIDQC